MYKIIAVAALAVVASARPQSGHGHGHGHAVSSQSLVLHQSHGHEQQNYGHQQQYHHVQPVALVQHGSTHYNNHNDHQVDYHAHPKYEYSYQVSDPHTGDQKSQHESRDGDVVQGVYSLHEADGTVRTVHYRADDHSGFNAEVRREGHAQHAVPQSHGHHH